MNLFPVSLFYSVKLFIWLGVITFGVIYHPTIAQHNQELPEPQQQTIDSLRQVLNTSSSTITKVKALNQLSSTYCDMGMYIKSRQTGRKARRLSRKVKYSKGIVSAYNNIGLSQWNQGYLDTALANYKKALKIAKKSGYTKGIADSYGNIGIIHEDQAQYAKARNYFKKSLQRYEEIQNKPGMANAYGSIGRIYFTQGDYAKALEYFQKSLKIQKKIDDRKRLAGTYGNIGVIHLNQGNYSQALNYYQKSLKIKKKLGDQEGIALSYSNIGIVYKKQGHYAKALDNYRKSLYINKSIGDRGGQTIAYVNIGDLYTLLYQNDTISTKSQQLRQEYQQYDSYALLDSARQYQQKALRLAQKIGHQPIITVSSMGLGKILVQKQKYKQALPYYHKAAVMADSTGALPRLHKAYKGLSKCYYKVKNFQKAYIYHTKYTRLQDSLYSMESREKIAEMEQKYQSEKRKRKIAQQQANLQQQRILLYSTGAGLLLIIIFSGLLYNRFRVIRNQKKAIETAHHKLENKNQQITSSINYAKRIQEALLKKEEHVSMVLPPHFVLLKPQSTVSGDFHWSVLKEDQWYLAVADCTGHGVPGGFLTMLGTAFLNELTSKPGQIQPAQILNQLRERFIKELGEEESPTKGPIRMRDGMDISLLRIDLNDKKAQWAGANNPLYLVRSKNRNNIQTKDVEIHQHSGYKLLDIPPDKQPVSYTADKKPFTNHELELQKNDTLYLFSDGYPDQFGGPRGKKFMYKQFKQTLLEIQDREMEEQKQYLDQTIEEWMAQNNEEQIDDICILGVNIS